MQHNEDTLSTTDGRSLFYQQWLPAGERQAAVALVHGVLEHCNRYGALVEHLPRRGFSLHAFDLRGHGRSDGHRVHIERWEQYRSDVDQFLARVRQEAGDRPVFLYGHSLGALIVLDYLLSRPEPVNGAIVSGAPIEPAGVASPLLVALARLLSRVAPTFRLPIAIEPTALTRDPEQVRAHQVDSLIEENATARWGAETLTAVSRVKAGVGKLQTPLLILHGEADPLNLVEGGRWLHEQVARSTLRTYPGGLHEPHNDIQRAQVAADVVAWLERQIGGS